MSQNHSQNNETSRMGKIIKFPTNRVNPVVQHLDSKYAEDINKVFIEEYIDEIGHEVINDLHRRGIDVDHDEFIIRFMFSLEVMKSVLSHNMGVHHRLTRMVTRKASSYFQDK